MTFKLNRNMVSAMIKFRVHKTSDHLVRLYMPGQAPAHEKTYITQFIRMKTSLNILLFIFA